jgi:hypothetical protein
MHDVTASEYFEGFDDLAEEGQCSFFGEGSFLLHQFIESASVAVFVDEVEVVGSFQHVDVLDDVGAALQSGEDVDFVDSALFQFGDFSEFLGLDHLDGDLLFGDEVDCFVDLRVDSFSQLLLEFVVLDYLAH